MTRCDQILLQVIRQLHRHDGQASAVQETLKTDSNRRRAEGGNCTTRSLFFPLLNRNLLNFDFRYLPFTHPPTFSIKKSKFKKKQFK